MPELVIEAPGRMSPGFLKRMRDAMKIMAAVNKADYTPELMEAIVDYLLPYVTEPADRVRAEALLWEASQEQIEEAMRAVGGGGDPLSASTTATA